MLQVISGVRFTKRLSLAAGARRLWNFMVSMRRAIEGRRAIARMDARMLADIGLSRADAQEEVRRKPWDNAPVRRERAMTSVPPALQAELKSESDSRPPSTPRGEQA